MPMLTAFMAYGYLLIVGFILLIMLIQVFAFYIAGKITGSINDEFTSALTLFGALFLIGMGSSLANVAIKTFLPDSVLPLVAAGLLFLFITIYAILKIYDLSVLSSILHFIISFGLMVIVIVGLGFLATRFIPQNGFQMDLGSSTESLIEDEIDLTEQTDGMAEEGSESDSFEVIEVTSDDVLQPEEESAAGGPKLPGTAVTIGSHADCDVLSGCESPDETCFADICQTKSEVEKNFEFTSDCATHPCSNCASGSLSDFSILFGNGTSIALCVECDGDTSLNAACREGFTCENYRCVAAQ